MILAILAAVGAGIFTVLFIFLLAAASAGSIRCTIWLVGLILLACGAMGGWAVFEAIMRMQ